MQTVKLVKEQDSKQMTAPPTFNGSPGKHIKSACVFVD